VPHAPNDTNVSDTRGIYGSKVFTLAPFMDRLRDSNPLHMLCPSASRFSFILLLYVTALG
jgi:hypothetical protein